jgi:hypothetical protein
VTPGSTTTYTLTAVGCGGTTTAAQTVVVAPAGDLWIIDIGLDTLNRVLMVVGKSGVISAPTYTYRIYRFRAFPLPGGSWVQVYEGTAPVPSGGIGAVTMPYVLPAPVVPFTNRVRVVIDPNNVIPETNEANNTIEQTCDVTVHNCS